MKEREDALSRCDACALEIRNPESFDPQVPTAAFLAERSLKLFREMNASLRILSRHLAALPEAGLNRVRSRSDGFPIEHPFRHSNEPRLETSQ